jgi:hypothetical protein
MHQIQRVSDVVQEPNEMLMPIAGYEDMPVVPLEIAIEPLVPFLANIQSYAYVAKQRCLGPVPDGLTEDESASIMLYSMDWEPFNKCLYVVLNETLRSKDRKKLRPWFLYLRLFLTALSRLPCKHRNVFRGVKLDLHKEYTKDKTIVWWGFSSCTKAVDVLQSESFLGTTGPRTMFAIECDSSRDISRHSYFSNEGQVLLLAATQFKIVASLNQGNGLHTVQLKEIQPPFPLLQPVALS